ncbi:DNA gyrase inhibitor YacG [Pokkaliibacter sp. CJK22405]|uniref:DNA gyrase inhibitor YacG n=1 Tax=Pokkaliibacter sp. CJK22405 TaxID=3384615 RepID=UPI003984A93E
MKYSCPTCKQTLEWSSENPYRPFCCERCKLIDLGAWADESYAVPAAPDLTALEFEEDIFFSEHLMPDVPAHKH